MVVAGRALLLLLLPPLVHGALWTWGDTRGNPGFSGAKLNVAWVAAVYLVASVMVTAGTTHIAWVTSRLVRDGASLESDFGFVALAGGIGALLWGTAADYFPARRLLMALAAPVPAGCVIPVAARW